ncbi:hypothetical protein CANARDRAFT_209023 [[Candida] arabinofermentans NRRL YB-2248]|uniref:DNA-directed RNA polymerase III subunit RPC3 n=1 Tax=[Candida] arabinofermentans NRRL YB-2248 TaxID=983967 RepID=A0A1E4SVZ9_9ASCO|nr:hypothetical protein CANARDRAFT_209023 [[Candida] arabinofermentans NRRL YB-2248]
MIPTTLPLSAKTQSPSSFLYTHILKLHLGEQAAYVFSIILNHNRLTLHQILKYSSLKSSNLKKILVSLIQLNCIVYTKDFKSSSIHYSINDEGVLKLIYANDIILQINNQYDKSYATVIQNILLSGHFTLNDYIQQKTNENTTEIEKIFYRLCKDKWLIPINEFQFQNKFDLFNQIFKKIEIKFNSDSNNKLLSQSKKLQLIKQQTKDSYLKLIENNELNNSIYINSININPNLSLTFNFDRFLKKLTSCHLQSLVKHRIGEISSNLYRLLLNRLESKFRSPISLDYQLEKFLANVGITTVGLDPNQLNDLNLRFKLKDQEKGLNFNVNDLTRELKMNGEKFNITKDNLIGTICDPSLTKKRKKSYNKNVKRVKLEDEDDDDEDGLHQVSDEESEEEEEEELDTPSLIMHHLKLLAGDPQFPFLIESTTNSYYIPLTELYPKLTKHTLKQYIKTMFGSDSIRVLNCIEKFKLLDEKSISKLVLLKENHVRNIIANLQRFNIIQSQEIPKTQDRSAMRAVYAYRFNYFTCLKLFKNSLIFNMAELLELIEDDKNLNKILLDKISRIDVKGKEKELLMINELKQLHNFYKFEKNCLSKFQRLKTSFEIFSFMSDL